MQDKSKILVVDDTPANLEVITRTLASENYKVTVAISGERALTRLKSDVPDLILLDIQMPGIDGFETCRRIKANADLVSIPVIFITALSDPESTVKGFSLGAVDYVSKPFRESELLARVKTHLELRHLNEQLAQQVTVRTQSLEDALAQLQSSQIQLVQQEKMSALGNLVAGIAHEINNPIGFVRGNVRELQRNLKDIFEHISLYQQHDSTENITEHAEDIDLDFLLEDIPKMIESMAIGCDRIRDISHSLRTFSREDQNTLTPFNLHDGLESTLLILKHRLKSKDDRPAIQVTKDYGDLPKIECFPGQLNQVFMNILANAIDAIEENYQKNSLDNTTTEPSQIIIKTSATDEQVHIQIRDNGPGMPETVKQKIFDHLFTTKEVGKGTGLGLAISHQIVVEKHGGALTVNSNPGHGTEFRIMLPR
ncbi:MAG: response regulator [Cyanobacteria bacterium J06626_14]